MYIANVQTKYEWEDVSELVSAKIGDTFAFSGSATYHITNNSDFPVYLVNTDTKPSEKDGVGMRLPANSQADFKPSSSVKLWALSHAGACDLCIEQEN